MNVICVDDSRLTLFSLRRKIGCIVPDARVAACHNAKQAVDSARKNGCDVLLTEGEAIAEFTTTDSPAFNTGAVRERDRRP